jgi:glycosyltransferase involved in cell wall biosynthesis
MSIDMHVLSHTRALHDTLGGFDERLLRFQDWDLALRYPAARTLRRIPVLATRYDWGSSTRISNQRRFIASHQMIRDKHAKPIASPLRVLFVCFDCPQLSESYVHAEIRWLLSHGVHIEVLCGELPRSPGQPLAPIHYGYLVDTIAAVAPDIVHLHWMSQTSHFVETLAQCGLPVTVRVHGFDYSDQLGRELARMPWLQRLYSFPGLQPGGRLDAEKWLPIASNFDSTRYYPPKSKNRRLVLRCGACLSTKDLQLMLEVAALRPEYRFLLVLSSNNHGIELVEALIRKSEELSSPAEIRCDLQYDEMAALMREASVYLHTFGYAQPFGQPISIAEAMACGTIPLARISQRALDYTGEAGLYYGSARDASELLAEMLVWDEVRWARQTDLCGERAYTRHADCVVLPAKPVSMAPSIRVDLPTWPRPLSSGLSGIHPCPPPSSKH